MYRAKAQGKNRCEEFHAGMHTAMLAHVQLDADLRRIGLKEQLTLQYQPILDISSGELVGFEALVRWRRPTRGLLTPSQFITRA